MSLVVLASVKGSPGVTTTALALAAAWPAPSDVVVAECDPAGGDVAAWFGLPGTPRLVGLATAARRDPAAATVDRHVQTLPGGTPVVVAPAAGEQAKAAVGLLAGTASRWRASEKATVLVDVGRLDPGGLVEPLVAVADLLVLVCRPTLAGLSHLPARLDAVRGLCRQVRLLLCGDGPYSAAEVGEALGEPPLGVIPFDSAGAALLAGQPASARALRRSPLLRSAGRVAADLLDLLSPTDPAPVEPLTAAASDPPEQVATLAGSR